jgi:transcriptional antiterminator/mannitol/fructose-specific phosphotransferase system IIA component (Ntr-type)
MHILLNLMDLNSPINISDLAHLFKVSNRTICNDLDCIDEFLNHNKLPALIRKPNVGVQFREPNKYKDDVLKAMGNISIYHYNLSGRERVNIILDNLIQERDFTTINDMADKLYVSRSTIVKDLRLVRKWLKSRGLELQSIPKHGIKVTGDEKKLRKAAMELLTESSNLGNKPEKFEIPMIVRVNLGVDREINNFFKDIDIVYIEECIKTAEKELNTVFSDAAYSGIVMHLAIAVKRIKLGRDIIMPEDELKSLQITKEFSVASNITNMLEKHFEINIPPDEIGYITVHLLGANISNTNRNKNKNWIDYELITEKIISEIDSKLNMDLSKDSQLFEGLLEHLGPAVYRLKHDLLLKNPLLNDIKLKYNNLFNIVKSGLKPLENYVGKDIDEEEVGYFTIHFGAAIERYKTSHMKKTDILVVCSTGVGTAKMLSSRLQAVFDVNIVDCIAYHQIKDFIIKNPVDIIVTTIPIKVEGIKTITVNPLLPERDIENLRKYINISKPKDSVLKELINIIEKHCTILDKDSIVKELSIFLNTTTIEKTRGVVQPLLKDILTEEVIKLNVEVKDWEDAVRKGGYLLEKTGAVEHRYVDAMVNSVKNIGPYIVIAPGIAMPHARPESGSNKVGMSLITLKNPVNFGNKENDPVKIVVCLCAIDHVTHLKALAELVEMLGDDENVKVISNSTDVREVLKMIKRSSTKPKVN